MAAGAISGSFTINNFAAKSVLTTGAAQLGTICVTCAFDGADFFAPDVQTGLGSTAIVTAFASDFTVTVASAVKG
ncbi:hypothetical protein KKH43_02215 [Patescibacteria group bacterium]|nr:hypothetical protein [Patescibacteria group bacterium]